MSERIVKTTLGGMSPGTLTYPDETTARVALVNFEGHEVFVFYDGSSRKRGIGGSKFTPDPTPPVFPIEGQSLITASGEVGNHPPYVILWRHDDGDICTIDQREIQGRWLKGATWKPYEPPAKLVSAIEARDRLNSIGEKESCCTIVSELKRDMKVRGVVGETK